MAQQRKKTGSPVIDAHNHPDWHGHNLERFLANMDSFGIDQTWLLSWECPADEYSNGSYCPPPMGTDGPIPFARCLAYAERAPGRFVLGYAPDPRRPEAIDRLAAAIEIYGVRVYGELKLRMMYDNPDALRLFRFCGEKKVPVIVHLDYEIGENRNRYPRPNWWYGGGIEAFERAIRKCPDTVFLGHGPGFWAHISKDGQHLVSYYPQGKVVREGEVTRLMRRYPNLYADLSAGSGRKALNRDPDHAVEFLLEFQERVLYARDCFDNGHQELLKSLKLPARTLAMILGGNARKLVPAGPAAR
ncbi:MAG: Amidohydrolase [candidate division TA06 bacterium ADurb.Bin417]|uniref:Amidohydrolase n=1 Tax=candidate division TA06 bacterium ADurb.Bin417 TaxID=1852828 RepID=A0A1V5MJG4_UNCT6|nr:MAG: Amidohydrolase [candidate division TA06 bacterium ADurb.Bin417]